MLSLDTLEDRRLKLSENFARKVLKHPEHRKMFKFRSSDRTRFGNKVYVPGQEHTDMPCHHLAE